MKNIIGDYIRTSNIIQLNGVYDELSGNFDYHPYVLDNLDSGTGGVQWLLDKGIELKYSEDAVDNASQNNRLDILDFWNNLSQTTDYEFKYSDRALVFNRSQRTTFEWWIRLHINKTVHLDFNLDLYKCSVAIGWVFEACATYNCYVKYTTKFVKLAVLGGYHQRLSIFEYCIKKLNFPFLYCFDEILDIIQYADPFSEHVLWWESRRYLPNCDYLLNRYHNRVSRNGRRRARLLEAHRQGFYQNNNCTSAFIQKAVSGDYYKIVEFYNAVSYINMIKKQ